MRRHSRQVADPGGPCAETLTPPPPPLGSPEGVRHSGPAPRRGVSARRKRTSSPSSACGLGSRGTASPAKNTPGRRPEGSFPRRRSTGGRGARCSGKVPGPRAAAPNEPFLATAFHAGGAAVTGPRTTREFLSPFAECPGANGRVDLTPRGQVTASRFVGSCPPARWSGERLHGACRYTVYSIHVSRLIIRSFEGGLGGTCSLRSR